jgi:hypothetical protein
MVAGLPLWAFIDIIVLDALAVFPLIRSRF